MKTSKHSFGVVGEVPIHLFTLPLWRVQYNNPPFQMGKLQHREAKGLTQDLQVVNWKSRSGSRTQILFALPLCLAQCSARGHLHKTNCTHGIALGSHDGSVSCVLAFSFTATEKEFVGDRRGKEREEEKNQSKGGTLDLRFCYSLIREVMAVQQAGKCQGEPDTRNGGRN